MKSVARGLLSGEPLLIEAEGGRPGVKLHFSGPARRLLG